MSDNFNQIPISVSNSNSTRQSNLNNLSSLNVTNNNISSTNLNNTTISKNISNHINKIIENDTDGSDIDHLDFKTMDNHNSSNKIDNSFFYNNNNSTNHNIHDDNDQENVKNRIRKTTKTPVADLIQSSIDSKTHPQQQLQHQQQQNQSNHRHRHETNLLKELMQLSIKKEKIEKALAATGYQNSTEAINWIMKHSKDALLNQDSVIATRDYILVICPIGRIATQISTFLQQSKLKCGNNEAHFNNLLPFMKLTPFFKVFFCLKLKLVLLLKILKLDGRFRCY